MQWFLIFFLVCEIDKAGLVSLWNNTFLIPLTQNPLKQRFVLYITLYALLKQLDKNVIPFIVTYINITNSIELIFNKNFIILFNNNTILRLMVAKVNAM